MIEFTYHPDKVNKAYYTLGIDPATTGKDEAAFIILEKKLLGDDPIKVIFTHTIEKCNTIQLKNFAVYLHSKFNFDKIYVDVTGLGEGVGDMLMEALGGNVVEPIKFTMESKLEMFENLRLIMQEKNIVFSDLDRKLTKQLLSIRFTFTGQNSTIIENVQKKKIFHDSREHDDLVCALCLAALFFSRQEKPVSHGYSVGR